MRGRTILILLIVLVLMVLGAIYFEARRHRATQTSDTLLFEGLNTELVDGILILEKGKETILEKQGDRWIVVTEGGFPVEPKMVTDILERLPKFYAEQVVSTNPSNQSLFQVDSAGVDVRIKQEGREIAHFIVGKPGPDFLSTYVRAANSDRVIQVPEYLPSLFEGRKTWRQKTIFDLKMDDVQSYEYNSPSRGHVLIARNEGGGWGMQEPTTGTLDNEGKLRMALTSFCKLKAADFADTLTAAIAGIEADTTWIRATLADGSTHKLTIGLPAPTNRSYVRKEGSESVVVVPRGAIGSMMPPSQDIPLKAVE